MPAIQQQPRIYDGDGDALMQAQRDELRDHLVLIPDAFPAKTPDPAPHLRIMWGQHLLDDVVAGRYRTLVCAVNTEDNSRGIIAQLASLLPAGQWDEPSITAHARRFSSANSRVKVLKFDMDIVEVLAVLRPPSSANLTIPALAAAFRIVADMIRRRPTRMPSASVSFLGARANLLLDENGAEPPFETILRTMHEAGYYGDVYPSPAMWHNAGTGLFARYPFSKALDRMREGGF